MTKQEIIERIARAEAEVVAIEATLDDSCHECPTCGLTVRHNYSDHRNKEVLAGIRQRLTRLVGSLLSSK